MVLDERIVGGGTPQQRGGPWDSHNIVRVWSEGSLGRGGVTVTLLLITGIDPGHCICVNCKRV